MSELEKIKSGDIVEILRTNSLLFNSAGEQGVVHRVILKEDCILAEFKGVSLRLFPGEFKVVKSV